MLMAGDEGFDLCTDSKLDLINKPLRTKVRGMSTGHYRSNPTLPTNQYKKTIPYGLVFLYWLGMRDELRNYRKTIEAV